MKYFILYHITTKEGVSDVNSSYATIKYVLNNTSIKRLELKMAKTLDVKKVTILSYKKVAD